MLPRVLLVEDDQTVRDALSLVLEGAGFAITAAADGDTALKEAAGDPGPDLIVLDIMLPGISGFDVCREVRAASAVPIMMLTARADTDDVVRGLELGADDYITKPFVPAELTARARAVLGRAADDDGALGPPSVWRHRDLVIDEAAFRTWRGDRGLRLTATEHRLLVELVHAAGKVLTREALLERVWGYDYLGDSRLVDMAVMRLRDKLGPASEGPDYIATVRGVGYRFERG